MGRFFIYASLTPIPYAKMMPMFPFKA